MHFKTWFGLLIQLAMDMRLLCSMYASLEMGSIKSLTALNAGNWEQEQNVATHNKATINGENSGYSIQLKSFAKIIF